MAALRFRELESNLWCLDQPLTVMGLHIGTRTTVVRLGDDTLWVHSPGPNLDELAKHLAPLGKVSAIVAPNRFHHLYAAAAKGKFPGSVLYAAPGLPAKRRPIRFDVELSDDPPKAWRDSLHQCLIRGAPMASELVFYHPLTKSLIVADLAFNMKPAQHRWTRIYQAVSGNADGFSSSRLFRACIRDKGQFAESVSTVLRWDIERVIVAHGEIFEGDGNAALQQIYGGMLPTEFSN